MELFGIALASIAGLALAPAFCLALLLVWRLPLLRRSARWAACVFLGLAALELALVSWFGALRVRELLGPSFFLSHLFLSVVAAPAVGTAIVLRDSKPGFLRLAVASIVSYCVGLAAIFYHVGVAESLFGIDGVNGSYRFPF